MASSAYNSDLGTRKNSARASKIGSPLFIVFVIQFMCTTMISGANLFSSGSAEHGPGLGRGPNSNLDMMDDHHDEYHGTSGLLGHADSDHHLPPQGLCEPIKIGLCMELGYNQTTMPNLVGHDVQGDADALLQTFTPLIQYGCSPNLKLFLCSAHVPMCTDKVPQPIGPCRSLCESVRRKCEPVLTEFGFKWPPPLDCSKFHPANNHQHMCIPDPSGAPNSGFGDFGPGGSSPLPMPPGNSGISPGTFKIIPPPNGGRRPIPNPSEQPPGFQFPVGPGTTFLKPPLPPRVDKDSKVGGFPKVSVGVPVADSEVPVSQSPQGLCVGPRKIWSKGSCWTKCGSLQHNPGDTDLSTSLFYPSERVFARNYALLWAILSLSAAIIALTLSVCSPKLSTAERPILYIALCQVLFSIGVIVGATGSVSCFTDKGTGMELLAVGTNVPSSCALVFLLTYFFSMAATLWWVILCLSWLLALNRDLCLSLQQKEWSVFHLVSWGLPSILTSAALIHKKVDADELTGLCGVGFQNMDALTHYNMIPLNVALSLGLIFLILGLLQRIFPGWKQLILHFGQPRSKSTGGAVVGAGSCGHSHNCERQFPHHQARNGYAPVLVLPPSNGGGPQHLQIHPCCTNRGNTVGSTPLTFSSNGVQRLRALENSKAIWMRVGIFALVHSLPIACQVGTMAYELSSREDWENGQERPNLQIFLLRLNMNLIAGLTAGVWVLSTYSWKSFSSFLQRLRCCCCCDRLRRSKSQSSSSKDKVHFRDGSLVTTATSDPLLPPITSSAQSPISNPRAMGLPLGNGNTAAVLSSFQPGCHVSQPRDNFAAILPRHHNHPLPRVPITTATNREPPRTDAWRRGETIV